MSPQGRSAGPRRVLDTRRGRGDLWESLQLNLPELAADGPHPLSLGFLVHKMGVMILPSRWGCGQEKTAHVRALAEGSQPWVLRRGCWGTMTSSIREMTRQFVEHLLCTRCWAER